MVIDRVSSNLTSSTTMSSIASSATSAEDSDNSILNSSSKTSDAFGNCFKRLPMRIQERMDSGDKFFSLEFFPPKTSSGAANLLGRMERMAQGGPLFVDITWHSKGDPGSSKDTSSTTIAAAACNYVGVETMLHMACCNATETQLDKWLRKAKDVGVKNVLALRGDPIGDRWETQDQFNYAVDLVRHIRKKYGDYFVIAVAGYPTGHPEAQSYAEDLMRLKEKVDAGADFIITQLFFTAETYLKFVSNCRDIGITCPILPGILPIVGYQSMKTIATLSKLEVPQHILDAVHSIKDNDEAVRRFGVDHAVALVRTLFDTGDVGGMHIYTMNREAAPIEILRRLGMWRDTPPVRALPWKLTANHQRREDVRPIFWSSRPRSYVYRTQDWDEFPNGRWGDSASPSFNDISDYYLFYLKCPYTRDEQRRMLGEEIACEQDVYDIFHCYITHQPNKNGYKVLRIPWNEEELAPETDRVHVELSKWNKLGILTTNSQPNVNCEPSTHPQVGWGNPGGYVFQKAYLEFFTCTENVECLKEVLAEFPMVNCHILNNDGKENYTNCHSMEPIAVTWGVFPGKEIVQPTVVDPISFKYWKDEAFDLWAEQWGKLYPADSRSRRVIDYIIGNYCLVNLVDNEFPGNCLWSLLERMAEVRRLRLEAAHKDWLSEAHDSSKFDKASLDSGDTAGSEEIDVPPGDISKVVST
ncbi:PREDICTED: methylenetetrahydrofolate reductase-like [Priapulus caudatus]|uniref:methylenetetrahydrofolate reductase (NADPH) n=1 Tax=Priapulus caudatus TaxID=37621 RepID=A0ABM1ELV9_PRICU|nr:PREDICTED: methylenetetrahydrofolate reductase-like [Priapulus caudatus]XP_014673179.1 PREDICTED: methylenetetrahydrofolate reductase-like [Priapulus caudatus]XP_014673180.1 PREDICTED: methylenetetrahydrofolate reductase-like [Priapulus caudatus]